MIGSRLGSRHRAVITFCVAAILAACQGRPAGSATPPAGVPSAPSTSLATPAAPSPTPRPTLPTGRLLFTRYAGNAEGAFVGFFILDARQSKATKVDLPFTVAGAGIPVWSPDGSTLLVNIYRSDTGARPATIKPDGSQFRMLEPEGLAGDLECTSWSADGRRLLCYVGSPNTKLDGMYELTLEGTELRRLTTSPYHYTEGSEGGCGGGEGRGVYSPDGSRFAFIRQKCGTGPAPDKDEEAALVVGDLATRKLTVIVERGVRTHAGSQLSWSPDGAWIAYGTQSLDLALVRPDGTDGHVVEVDADSAGIMGPTWSPDGSAILVCTLLSGNLGSMYVVVPDGSGASIVSGTSGGAFPSWTGS